MDKTYEDIVTNSFEKIHYIETTNIKAVIDKIEHYLDNLHIHSTTKVRINNIIKTSNLSRILVSDIKSYFTDTNFAPLFAYIGDSPKSVNFGKLFLYGTFDNVLYKVYFRIKSINGNSFNANQIDSIRQVRVFLHEDKADVLLHVVDVEDSYGFGACMHPNPILETNKQIELHNLEKSLKNWSVSNEVNKRLYIIKHLKENQAYI